MRTLLLTLALAASALPETAGGLKWTAPPSWKAQPQRPMRAATYAVPRASGDPEDGECAVFYFGPGQGGGVDANIKRWTAQFDADRPANTSKSTTNGLAVTRIDVTGAYKAAAGPMMQPGPPKPGYRLLGAIIEGPQGAVFFKFTGPQKTVATQQQAFESLLRSVAR